MINHNFQKLKQLAIAAIPGPWKLIEKDNYIVGVSAPWGDKVKPETTSGYGDYRGIHICETSHQNDNPCVSKAQAVANMEFIAAANPEVITRLIQMLEKSYRERDRLIISTLAATSIKDGDMLLCPDFITDQEKIQMMEVIRYLNPQAKCALFFGDIKKLNEKEMNQAGWYRMEPQHEK